jgi:ribonuclease HI
MQKAFDPMIEIFTDGACSGNPGPGGWGVYIVDGDRTRELYGGEPDTTNNRMEMQAVIEALRTVSADEPVVLYTDSQYVKNGITSWIHGWKKNGWKTASKKPVKNKDLWIALDDLSSERKIEWRWVKGHAGDEGNEKADELARRGAGAC